MDLCDKSKDILISQDTLNEGIHFSLKHFKPEELAYKALAVNISDICAMGGSPFGYVLSLSIPKYIEDGFINGFIDGISKASKLFGITPFGGDTCSSKTLSITITILGNCPKGKAVKRSGAMKGDLIFATGFLGNSALGLEILSKPKPFTNSEDLNYFINAHKKPLPRVKFAQRLSALEIATSMIDISDGIFEDITHILDESKKGAVVFEENIPLSPKLKKFCKNNKLNAMVFYNFGEDYELIFTIKPTGLIKLLTIADETGTRVTNIGRITSKKRTLISQNQEKSLPEKSFFQHF